jgi:uncharacterized membrane protein YgdD (TMEM256/DUF423 family)
MIFSSRRLIPLFGGLLGAAGVALAAGASHGGDAHFLGSASTMCLAHAPALLALHAGYGRLRAAGLAALLLGLGTLLFAADLVCRHAIGNGLFPLAAPTGGFMMISGWIVVSLGALWRQQAT